MPTRNISAKVEQFCQAEAMPNLYKIDSFLKEK